MYIVFNYNLLGKIIFYYNVIGYIMKFDILFILQNINLCSIQLYRLYCTAL